MKRDKTKTTTVLGAPKEESPHQVLEEMDTMYNPATQHLDLSREQKRRTTALMMAIQAYSEFICKDAEMYVAMSRDHDRDPEKHPPLRPATMDAIVNGAIQFDLFISGAFDVRIPRGQVVNDKDEGKENPPAAAL